MSPEPLEVCEEEAKSTARKRRSASELLETPGALLQRKHFHELGLERRAVDSIYRHCRVIYLPDYSHGMIRVEEYLAFLDGHTYCDRCGDRVVPA